ncbi:LysR family hpxDE operon transcriptional regulator HpxR [Klebsiella aerogenes]|uniref:Putative LysR family regulatory protein n=1 Tax=Klebsiella aerogenes (strain ATCC 13048 / DSM 30053 / CCUG 1429 / JCM 1235 / KCTC 2190 / NBRC 13534 / NCIMB 10102 / NCTC 10006 / CDC 819-56) TaxID=1028307 RepID=A0A0H3FW33_KLEAK|nr:LysR family hpxDE operon transcriptional regulator HpxR [Klebsiella aerogenes]AEG98751.1 putative LysR family regulatory protein [Klebsiella aerogenes KCTC 2190]KLF33454.1 LysR family transcriptional regulator [Klebsiella aerogenes]MEB7532782.1 LysR family hpxDE operon transcriptional regulator HpxR [Klebsiella aerogenes]MEC4757167.1 LysR family hpxDE operon transcriptional regulator HpxR [Klebsiella aerogenes]QEU18438.1 LysR family hpxDE operon transcriptional regulator HpxR [Klebsiella ae
MSPFSRFAHYFMEVARSGSLRRAAEKLHISASAINRQILQAEASFGTPLFERLPEGLRMTTAGELLYDNLLRWQKEFRVTQQKFDELQGLKRGTVNVGMVQALAEGSFAAALAEIINQCEWLELMLQVADSQSISDRVRQADVDFGLILDPEGQAGLNVLAFIEMEVGVVLHPHHPFATAPAISLGELSDERHIIPGAPLIVHDRVAMLYRHYDFSPPNTVSCNDIRLIKSLVLKGGGVTVLSLLDVQDEVNNGSLAFVPLRNKLLRPLTLALCTAPSRQLSRPAQMAIQKLTLVMEEMRSAAHSQPNGPP